MELTATSDFWLGADLEKISLTFSIKDITVTVGEIRINSVDGIIVYQC